MSKAESTIKKQRTPVKTKKRTNWILWIASMALIISVAVTIVDQNVRIHNARAELEELNDKISLQDIKLNELKKVADAVEKGNFDQFDDYIQKKARMYGFAKEDEVVFINIAGD